MSVDEIKHYKEVLEGITGEPYDQDFYQNEDKQWGYRATYRVGNDWYWYSVPGVTVPVSPAEVAAALANGYDPTRCGVVKMNGLEATIRCDDQWYMINRGSKKP